MQCGEPVRSFAASVAPCGSTYVLPPLEPLAKHKQANGFEVPLVPVWAGHGSVLSIGARDRRPAVIASKVDVLPVDIDRAYLPTVPQIAGNGLKDVAKVGPHARE